LFVNVFGASAVGNTNTNASPGDAVNVPKYCAMRVPERVAVPFTMS